MDTARYAALFQSEAREHLDEVDRVLLAIEAEPRSTESQARFASLFRSMHTIKGMAATMGYAAVEKLSHSLESYCEPLRNGTALPDAQTLTQLFDSTAELRKEIDRLALVRPDKGASNDNSVSVPDEDSSKQRVVSVRLVDDCPLKGVRALVVIAKLHMLGKVTSTEPPQAAWQNEAFDGVFAVHMLTDADDDSLLGAVYGAGEIQSASVATHQVAKTTPVAPVRTVRLDANRLDSLLDLSSELAIARDVLLRSIESMPVPDRQVILAARDVSRLVNAFQAEVLQARLQPASQVFDRFPRLVRDIAHELGKDVRFVTEGGEIELDRSLLDAIADPLLHLLRNALDHGLESPEERASLGKLPAGELVLRAARDRGQIVIQVQDDGRGIDRNAVLRRAQSQGFVAREVQVLNDDELLSLISRAGLSTASQVSMLSGRGVGVDVVNVSIRSLGGRVELETIEGSGTVFTLRLPSALGVMRALLVVAGQRVFALPAGNIEEILLFDEDMTCGSGMQEQEQEQVSVSVTVRESTVPLLELESVFAREDRAEQVVNDETLSERHLVIVSAGGQRAALLVSALVGQQDIVVKPLNFVRGSKPWFSGATVLGDGTPALIVDLSSVLSLPVRSGVPARQQSSQREETMVGAR